jgi:hypothetical protein
MAGQVVQAIIVPRGASLDILKDVLGDEYENVRLDMEKDGEGAYSGAKVYVQKERNAFKSVSGAPQVIDEASGIAVVTGELREEGDKAAGMAGVDGVETMSKEAGFGALDIAMPAKEMEYVPTLGDRIFDQFYSCMNVVTGLCQQSGVDQKKLRAAVAASLDALKTFVLDEALPMVGQKGVVVKRTGGAGWVNGADSVGVDLMPYGFPEFMTRVISEVRRAGKGIAGGAGSAGTNSAEKATWTTAYVNGLPNSAFVVVEKGYDPNKEGMSDKGARHLPYKDNTGAVDMPHLRNAMARAGQIESVLGVESTEELRARAQKKCEELRKKYLSGDGGGGKSVNGVSDTDGASDNMDNGGSVGDTPENKGGIDMSKDTENFNPADYVTKSALDERLAAMKTEMTTELSGAIKSQGDELTSGIAETVKAVKGLQESIKSILGDDAQGAVDGATGAAGGVNTATTDDKMASAAGGAAGTTGGAADTGTTGSPGTADATKPVPVTIKSLLNEINALKSVNDENRQKIEALQHVGNGMHVETETGGVKRAGNPNDGGAWGAAVESFFGTA